MLSKHCRYFCGIHWIQTIPATVELLCSSQGFNILREKIKIVSKPQQKASFQLVKCGKIEDSSNTIYFPQTGILLIL
ncbi:Hypothetical predicted protein [Podarcis lilfordi]|uniref:Uncharacterized protein n=1 Tax=Podarcis lilfordi TaxID=74358 RepID=A0AA35JXV7_9SAUR|nr:Hypothetical predicted protein [Podarcis lilfordi]